MTVRVPRWLVWWFAFKCDGFLQGGVTDCRLPLLGRDRVFVASAAAPEGRHACTRTGELSEMQRTLGSLLRRRHTFVQTATRRGVKESGAFGGRHAGQIFVSVGADAPRTGGHILARTTRLQRPPGPMQEPAISGFRRRPAPAWASGLFPMPGPELFGEPQG